MPQIAISSVPSDPATIAGRYDALVASGAIECDPAQERVVAVLDALARRLTNITPIRFGLTKLLDQGASPNCSMAAGRVIIAQAGCHDAAHG